MGRFGTLGLLASLMLFGCSHPSYAEQADDIREAVFRYQFEHCYGRERPRYLLAVDDQPPRPALLKRFEHYPKPIIGNPGNLPITARVDHAEFYVGKITWLSRTAVEVEGACGVPTGLEGGTYHVIRKDHQWIVTGHQYTWAAE